MPVTAEAEPTTIEKILDGFDNLVLHRYPHVVGPPFVAVLALGLAEGTHRASPSGWALLAVVAAVVFVLALDSVARLPGRREKLYALACWLCGAGWTVAAARLGPTSDVLPWVHLTAYSHPVPPLLTVWALILAASWPPWTNHRRVRRSVDVASEILAWDGDAVGLPEVRLSTAGAKADGDGWQAPLIPKTPGEWTTDKLRKTLPRIASHYHRAVHEFSIDPVIPGREGKWVLRFREARKRAPVLYQVPMERPSARKPFILGHVTADPTTPVRAEVWRERFGGVDSLITGQKGHGKSTLLKRMSLHAIASKDGLLFLGDMKPGNPDYREIGTRGAFLYATTAEQIDLLIRILLVLCRVRGQNPRKNRKVIFVELDEMSLYFSPTLRKGSTPQAKAEAARIDMARQTNFNHLAATSRAFDMAIWLAVQKGKEKNTGGDARAAISAQQNIGFYAPKASDGTLVSSNPNFDPSRLPKGISGRCIIENSLHEDAVYATTWDVTDEIIHDVCERFASSQAGLDEDELQALRDEFGDEFNEFRMANRKRTSVPDESEAEDESEDVPAPTPIVPQRMSAEQSLQATYDALCAFSSPVATKDVAARLNKSEPMVRARLGELVDAGRALRHGTGRWVKYEAVRVT